MRSDSKFDQYVTDLYPPEDPGLRSIRERLVLAGRWGVNIGAVEGRTLQLLIRLARAKTAVEIGSLFGYSGVWIARALPADGHLYTIEREPICAQAAREGFEVCGVSNKVTLMEGEATDMLIKLSEKAPFDFIFIDANKSAYPAYLEWADTHLRSGGVIVADNTLLGGALLQNERPEKISQNQWSAMRYFNHALTDPNRYVSTLLPTSEGLSVAIKI